MEALSKAESDISFAARKLEHAFKTKSDESVQKNGNGSHIPNPIKIVRRLTALELAMVQLRKDCKTIAEKRTDIVSRVVVKQNQNVENVENLLRETEDTAEKNRYSGGRNSEADRNWVDLSKDLNKQSNLLNAPDKN